jgi:hypothetical protein
MGIPGFTAQDSVSATHGHYRASSRYGSVSQNPIGAAEGSSRSKIDEATRIPVYSRCNAPGKPCCGPDFEVNTQHCRGDVGCNIATGKCEPCGAPGQVCCDGPYTGFSNKSYEPAIFFGLSERIESCDAPSRCDAVSSDGMTWIGTRRCQTCGNKKGGPCCAPDVRHALEWCIHDAQTGEGLICDNPYAAGAAMCVPCGQSAGQPACRFPGEYPCAEGLSDVDGICQFCGYPGQPTCDRGTLCDPRLAVPDPTYSRCVAAGGPNQPCLPGANPCTYELLFCNSQHVCEECGQPGEICCPAYTEWPRCQTGVCTQDNRCFACGHENMPVCPSGPPCIGGEPVDGWCRHCGREGEPCCYSLSIICDSGLHCDDGTCRGSGGGGSSGSAKTCSGQDYTLTTFARAVAIEATNGCAGYDLFIASTPAEALQCARAKYGAAVIEDAVENYDWAVICNGSCTNVTFSSRDYEGAARCAYSLFPSCTTLDAHCPES